MAARIEAPPADDDDFSNDEEEIPSNGLIQTSIHVALVPLRPLRPLISRPALRAYLSTILAVCTAFTLLGLAIVAYLLFYNLYIPRIGFSRPLHLQYDHILQHHQQDGHPHPWATTTLAPDITSAQGYDITLNIVLPHTPSNREAGNFMLDIQLLAPSSALSATGSDVLARSRMPALLPYRSRAVHLAQTCLSLPYYILGWRSESTTLTIPAFSRVEFPKGWRTTPSTLRLEIQSINVLQIEKAEVHFRARFRGLRWVMYNHRIVSAGVFVGLFWGVECFFAGLAWAVISLYFSSAEKVDAKREASSKPAKQQEIKEESPAMSDTERIFPSRTGSGVVRYSSPDVKRESKEEEVEMVDVPEHVAKAAEADVEDEGDDSDEGLDFRDSGIGTSLESETLARRDSMRRRRGQRGRTEGKE